MIDIVRIAASSMGAVPADRPGLWNMPGYPELTSGQLLAEFGRVSRNLSHEERAQILHGGLAEFRRSMSRAV